MDHIHLDEDAGSLAATYWQWLFLSQTWREAGKLSSELRRPPTDLATPAAVQFIAKFKELAAVMDEIEDAERAMNERLFVLHGLTEAERLLVEGRGIGRVGATNH